MDLLIGVLLGIPIGVSLQLVLEKLAQHHVR